MDPLIGLVNQIQMIQDQTSAPPSPFQGRVWFSVWPVGEAVDCPFETLPVASHNTKPADPAGQRSADENLVKAPGVPVGLIQDLTDKKPGEEV